MLPEPAAPVASYKAAMKHGDLLYVSGQLPFEDGELITGILGDDLEVDRGIEAARACGLMILAQIERELGSLDKVAQIVKLSGFVASKPKFADHPKVINGASDLMFDVFEEKGRHARSAVGVAALPLGAAVEVEAIVAFEAE
jgi:enamine deaminase RidA (YjgF/YER057c/UK114 family)